jgi:hypothetical protein
LSSGAPASSPYSTGLPGAPSSSAASTPSAMPAPRTPPSGSFGVPGNGLEPGLPQ